MMVLRQNPPSAEEGWYVQYSLPRASIEGVVMLGKTAHGPGGVLGAGTMTSIVGAT